MECKEWIKVLSALEIALREDQIDESIVFKYGRHHAGRSIDLTSISDR